MPPRARYYAWTVVATGALILVSRLNQPAPALDPVWGGCLLLAVAAGALKLHRPGMEGTYSPTFLPILYVAVHSGMTETVLIGCAAALAQSYLNVRSRPTALQAAFNAGNLVITIAAVNTCFSGLAGIGVPRTTAASLVVAAVVYFVVNTCLDSGFLARLQGRSPSEVAGNGYYWSLPYFLTGVAAIELTSSKAPSEHWEAILVIAALLGLLHFYSTLEKGMSTATAPEQEVNVRARLYYLAVLVAALALACGAFLNAGDMVSTKFTVYLLLTMAASTWKVRLPGLDGTISVNFVMLLAAIVDLSLAQTVIIAAAGALVQCLWRPANRPKLMPVAFSTAVLVISASLVHVATRQWWSTMPLLAILLCGTALLYAANTMLVSLMFCLIEGRSLGMVWHHCHFWTFNYYLVGAAAAGILISTVRNSGLVAAALILPAMTLVWISFRLHADRVMAHH